MQRAEADRIFCRHTLQHFLDVARIARIESLEAGVPLASELIYAAALLHDLGRYAQLAHGTPHEQAGAELAQRIMADCGFSKEETACVCGAIRGHRRRSGAADGAFGCGQDLGTAEYAKPADRNRTTADSCQASEGAAYAKTADTLAQYLYRADKLSRCCFACPASSECNWSAEQKNNWITI